MTLEEFLAEYREWAVEAPPHPYFSRDAGLCWAALCTPTGSIPLYTQLGELLRSTMPDGGPYPFDKGQSYAIGRLHEIQHLNPMRLAWIDFILDGGEGLFTWEDEE